MVRKGQVFILSALIFSSLIVLVGFSYDSIVQTSGESTIKSYFDHSKNDHVQSFNHGLKDNYSVEYIKKNLYTTDRFIYRRSLSKGIDYNSINFFILPEKGTASIINYQEKEISPKIRIGSDWTNTTVKAKQNREISFTPEDKEVKVILKDADIQKNFKASSPRLLNFIEMSKQNEKWRSSSLH